ncbi:MAG: hypothetical protein WCK74_03800 [Gemmatimonadaceae bacterium]
MLWWPSLRTLPRATRMHRRRILALVQLLLCVLTVGQAARPCPQRGVATPASAMRQEMASHDMATHDMATHEMPAHEMPADTPAHDMPAHDMPHDAPCTAMPGCAALMPDLPDALWQSTEAEHLVDAPVGAVLPGSHTEREVEAPPPRG